MFSDAAVLFDQSHVREWSPMLALYLPFGLVVAALRSVLWIMGIALDAPWFRTESVVRGYLSLLGVRVTWRNAELLPADRHILVSNHCSVGDLMSLFNAPLPTHNSRAHGGSSSSSSSSVASSSSSSAPRRYVHLITPGLPARVTQTKHLPVILRHASPAVYDELGTTTDPTPIHLFPEGGMTNGRAMMSFSRGFTRIMQGAEAAGRPVPVVPAALRVKGLLPGVCTHTLTSSFFANLFWLSFNPSLELEVTVLPAMQQEAGESRGSFVKRVQAAIAEELRIGVSPMTIQHKRQLVQREAGAAGAAKARRRA